MVTKWGLSEDLGPLTYAEDEAEVFLGQAVTSRKNVSDETARLVDTEVRALIDRNYQRAKQLLKDNVEVLHCMANALVESATLDSEQISAIMARRSVHSGSRDVESTSTGGLDRKVHMPRPATLRPLATPA